MLDLSICITILNRSRCFSENGPLLLFPWCCESLSKAIKPHHNAEIVIADWGSTDWPLKEWIGDYITNVPIHIVNIKGNGFSAGAGRNIAAAHAESNNLFFLDADMIVNSKILDLGIKALDSGNVFYPVVKYAINDVGKLIIHEGGGNVFVNRKTFLNAGKWPEYWSHGFEDTVFAENIKKIANVTTDESDHIYHQWHPQDKAWKNRYSTGKDVQVIERHNHYSQKQNNELVNIKDEIGNMLNNDPNTTHNTLRKPAR